MCLLHTIIKRHEIRIPIESVSNEPGIMVRASKYAYPLINSVDIIYVHEEAFCKGSPIWQVAHDHEDVTSTCRTEVYGTALSNSTLAGDELGIDDDKLPKL